MAVKKANFAVDMTPEGVNLWERGKSGDWLGLGFVCATDADFNRRIEDARMSATQQHDTLTEVRIPASDVFVTQIRAADVPDKVTDAAVLALVADKLPFKAEASQLCVDSCKRGSGRLSVAVVQIETLKDAAEFVQKHGFTADYFTSVVDPMLFPTSPTFRLTDAPISIPALRNSTNQTLKLATGAGVALCTLGLILTGTFVFTAPEPEVRLDQPEPTVVATLPEEQPVETLGAQELSVAIDVGTKIPLPQSIVDDPTLLNTPKQIATRTPDASTPPDLTAGLAPPPKTATPLPKDVLLFALADGDHKPVTPFAESSTRESLFQRKPATKFTSTSGTLQFGQGGLTTSTKKLLNNSVISIEEPSDGNTGRKTIRILPFDPDKGAWNSRFDPDTFVRVAQASTANDATPGFDASSSIIPLDRGATLIETTAAGTRIFAGRPAVVPPARPGSQVAQPSEDDAPDTTTTPPQTAMADEAPDDMSQFTSEIESVLDQSESGDALVAAATAAIDAASELDDIDEAEADAGLAEAENLDVNSVINTPDANTVRPRPRPGSVLAESSPSRGTTRTPSVGATSGQKIHIATDDTLRPKPRPIGMDKAANAREIERAVTAAIAAGTGTAQAVFISRIPKSRPANMRDIAERTRASLTTAALGPNAVVRTAPKGVEEGSNTLTTSNTSKSVAALATERARLSKSSMTLIGIFGSASSRRALLRLGSGRYVKVKSGDKVSGWKISAIGESSVRVDKGSRNHILRLPE